MRSGTPYVVAFVIASASAVTACGSEEVFEPQLTGDEQLIDRAAVAQLAKDDQGMEDVSVVGDLDGDGIDDAVLRTSYIIQVMDLSVEVGSTVYVVYGGTVTGKVDLSTLPSLTGAGVYGTGISAVGDVNGDGLADFLVGVGLSSGCLNPAFAAMEDLHSGAYLVYGSRARLTGATPIADTAVFLRDATTCTSAGVATGLGDLDGDGKADFAIGKPPPRPDGKRTEIFVFYGRSERLSGAVDLASAADATISVPMSQYGSTPKISRVGDVDGDGHADFVVEMALETGGQDIRLVQGGATRLAGAVALDDVGHTRFLPRCWYVHGRANALGDLDGDGIDDFSMQSCEDSSETFTGFVMAHRVFYGRAGGFPAEVDIDQPDATLRTAGDPPSSVIFVGTTSIIGADVNGDGVRDLIVGDASLHDNNGGVHVVLGDGARLSGTVSLVGRGTTYVGRAQHGTNCGYLPHTDCVAHDYIGVALGVGDLMGDHQLGILVSAPTDQGAAANLGVHGSSLGHAYLVPLGGTKP
jgi:hypothetical protein